MGRWLAMMILGVLMTTGTGCQSVEKPPLQTVSHVDIPRFMGDWYVIASIPTFLEKDIYNAIERYDRIEPEKIKTTFTYYKGDKNGKKHEMNPVGYIKDDGSNAIWGMQFIWPFKADYRVVYLDESYSVTIIGRQKRDYVWIMARQPSIDNEQYEKLINFVESLGYDISKLNKVPQRW